MGGFFALGLSHCQITLKIGDAMGQRFAWSVLVGAQLSFGATAFAWGETGHNLIGRVAARIVGDDLTLVHPGADPLPAKAFSTAISSRYMQMGHLANIPDIHWRNLDNGDGEDGSLLGDAAHFFDSDMFVDAHGDYQVSLDYEDAKHQFQTLVPNGKFYQNGTLPWRAQQLFNLYVWNLKQYPRAACGTLTALANHPTRTALAFAGIMTHFSGDVSQPYHMTTDYNGVATNQKGIHSYFESDIVDALEFDLDAQVYARAKELLNASTHKKDSVAYFEKRAETLFGVIKPENEVVALMLAVGNDSLAYKNRVGSLDAKYAIATAEEAWTIPACKTLNLTTQLKAQFDAATTDAEKKRIAATKVMAGLNAAGVMENACRRDVNALVDRSGDLSPHRGRPVKDYFADLIVERLAISAAVTAHLWAKGWELGGAPALCMTYQYALKPTFVSPTDAACFGYALQETPGDFPRKDGTSALPWKHAAASTDRCISF